MGGDGLVTTYQRHLHLCRILVEILWGGAGVGGSVQERCLVAGDAERKSRNCYNEYSVNCFHLLCAFPLETKVKTEAVGTCLRIRHPVEAGKQRIGRTYVRVVSAVGGEAPGVVNVHPDDCAADAQPFYDGPGKRIPERDGLDP